MALIGALALALLAGCAGGPDARTAQQLLRQAQAEQLKLRSSAFVVKLGVDVDGQRFGMTMDGAAETGARQVGDMFLRMTVEGMPGRADAGGFAMAVAKRGSQITVHASGQTQTFDAGDEQAPDFDAFASVASFDFSSCIERLAVDEGRTLNGEPATRIAGTIDTACLLKAAAAMSGAPMTAGIDFAELAKNIGDVRATLFVSERSKLLVGAVITTQIDADGKRANLSLSYRLTAVNQPVRIPPGL